MKPATPLADAAAAAALCVAALVLLCSFAPLQRPVVLDPATWDYMSLRISGGMIPYRDVFLHKTPGAMLLGALGARLGPFVGLTALQGAHALFVLLGALAPALLFLVCRARMTLAAALTAAVMLPAFDQWVVASVEGVRPKVATTTLGLACLLAASRGKATLAGLLGGAAALCWQPGAAFLAGAVVELWRDDRAGQSTRRRGTAMVELVAGAAAPCVLLAAWLAWHGALADAVSATVGFNRHYIALHARSVPATLTHLHAHVREWNPAELLLLAPAAFALATGRTGLPIGLTVAGLGYLAMCLVNFQAWPDTILLLPPLAALAGAGLHAMTCSTLERAPAAALALVVAAAAAVTPQSARLHPPLSFAEQAEFMHELERGIAKDEPVLVVSLPEFLIHTGRDSLWPWPYMWFGVDRYAADHTTGGFEAILSRLQENDPPLMIVARRWSGPLRRRFEQWARARYSREQIFAYPHTVRPINVYRRK